MDDHVHGKQLDVIRQILKAARDGEMDVDQVAELLATMADTKHDVTSAFRVALIAQGAEREALMLHGVRVGLSRAGATFEYSVQSDLEETWLDDMPPDLNLKFLQASIWVLRAGNVNASIAPDGTSIELDGYIRSDIEQIVEEFVKEIDEQFPADPPPRQGTWW